MIALLVVGLGTYLLLWSDNDVAPNPNHAGEWRSCPLWLRRLTRRGSGFPLVPAVFGEVAGLVTAAVAALDLAGLLQGDVRPAAAWVIVGVWLLALLSMLAVEVRARFRLRL